MFDMTLLDLMRQRRDQVERNADRARLVREARQRRRRGNEMLGR